MNWSYSGYRQFKKCNRQWYYSNIVAHQAAKEPFRKEVTILSKLKTIDAWRGDIVDQVISQTIINKIRKDEGLDEDNLLWRADRVFEEQYDFALKKKYREENLVLSEYEYYSALIDLDNDRGIDQETLDRARMDIHQSLKNFLDKTDLIDYLRSASQWLTQRDIQYPFSRFRAKGRPDLIVFFEDEPPHIFDWKVHTFATKTYQDQLLSYAFALNKANEIKPHKDFPSNLSAFTVLDYRLTEFQLLIDEVRDYTISEEDINETENEIASGLMAMYRVGANKKYDECSSEDFPTAHNPSSCEKCQFKSICKQ
ncbi:PD-(D/E)XK nuclease family protein [Ekhidna sp.]|uniref:PD-(D/E)XK nuclease family protein n=1 Tax=Ekhidna sp. TaxID=2608089 RepID=UPI0032F05565